MHTFDPVLRSTVTQRQVESLLCARRLALVTGATNEQVDAMLARHDHPAEAARAVSAWVRGKVRGVWNRIPLKTKTGPLVPLMSARLPGYEHIR